MEISRLVYLGPNHSKVVTGAGEFVKDAPKDVIPRVAASILREWPGSFAAVLPCPTCEPGQVDPLKVTPSVRRGRPRKAAG